MILGQSDRQQDQTGRLHVGKIIVVRQFICMPVVSRHVLTILLYQAIFYIIYFFVQRAWFTMLLKMCRPVSFKAV